MFDPERAHLTCAFFWRMCTGFGLQGQVSSTCSFEGSHHLVIGVDQAGKRVPAGVAANLLDFSDQKLLAWILRRGQAIITVEDLRKWHISAEVCPVKRWRALCELGQAEVGRGWPQCGCGFSPKYCERWTGCSNK